METSVLPAMSRALSDEERLKLGYDFLSMVGDMDDDRPEPPTIETIQTNKGEVEMGSYEVDYLAGIQEDTEDNMTVMDADMHAACHDPSRTIEFIRHSVQNRYFRKGRPLFVEVGQATRVEITGRKEKAKPTKTLAQARSEAGYTPWFEKDQFVAELPFTWKNGKRVYNRKIEENIQKAILREQTAQVETPEIKARKAEYQAQKRRQKAPASKKPGLKRW